MVDIRRFKALPLGTRFRFTGWKKDVIWVILDKSRHGKITKWEGVDGPVDGQVICSFSDTEEGCELGKVIVLRQ